MTTRAGDQALADNNSAPQHQISNGQCISGYVWREANPQDHVCVTPPTRTQTAKDNAAARTRVGASLQNPQQAGGPTAVTPSQAGQLSAGVQAGGSQGVALASQLVQTLAGGQTPSGLCKPGFVWRRANAQDHVCVTPQIRQQVADDNAAASQHQVARSLKGRGPPACLSGYVWRMADAQDYVCVTPGMSTQTAKDNNNAAYTTLAHAPPRFPNLAEGSGPLIDQVASPSLPGDGRSPLPGDARSPGYISRAHDVAQASAADQYAHDRAVAQLGEIKARLSTEGRAALDRGIAEHKRIKAQLSPASRAALDRFTAPVERALENTSHRNLLATATAVVQRAVPRFSASESQAVAAYALSEIVSAPDGSDVAEAAVIVILAMVEDTDHDLQEQMQEAEAVMQAKQGLRVFLDPAGIACFNRDYGSPGCPGEQTPTNEPIPTKKPIPVISTVHYNMGGVQAGGSGTCPAGFFPREAYLGDRLCVSSGVRDQTIADNSAAPSHTNPERLCIQGYVWRRAIPSDHVCVTPASRAQAQSDNGAGVQIQGTVQQQVAPPQAGFTPRPGTVQSRTTTPVGAAKATTVQGSSATTIRAATTTTLTPPKKTVRPPKLNIAKPSHRGRVIQD